MKIILFLTIFITTNSWGQTDSILLPMHTIINNARVYKKSVNGIPAKEMMDVSRIQGVLLDLKYAGEDNFMHKKLYRNALTTFLRKRAFTILKAVEGDFISVGLTLKIWDAYRPYSVTIAMWDKIKDERYVANPKNGSGHNKGLAVDLTLVDLHSGTDLNMGTGFDNFTDSAHADFNDLPSAVIHNRKILRNAMIKHGFKNLETEWWHFYLPDIDNDEILDISFSALRKITKKNSSFN